MLQKFSSHTISIINGNDIILLSARLKKQERFLIGFLAIQKQKEQVLFILALRFVIPMGLEPMTPTLKVLCSTN